MNAAPPQTLGPTQPPPPPPAETPAAKPGYVWATGQYEWRLGKWEWVPGHWERERRGKRWEAARWERRGNVYVKIDGGWR
jgi:hypothetical protein